MTEKELEENLFHYFPQILFLSIPILKIIYTSTLLIY